MGYLICDKCDSSYELKEGESASDFEDKCECGGNLKEVENLENSKKPKTQADDKPKKEKISILTGETINEQRTEKGVPNKEKSQFQPVNLDKSIKSDNNLCIKCGTKNPETAEFCIKCGNPLDDRKKFCSQCGTKNPFEAQFCQKCGKPFSNKPEPTQDKPTQNEEYLDVLKKQEKHSKDLKQALFVIFFIVVIIPIIIWLWWVIVASR